MSKRALLIAPIAVVAAIMGCAAGESTVSHAPARDGFVRNLPAGDQVGPLLGRTDSVVMRSGLVVLQPGKDCGWHSTDDYEEMIVRPAGAGGLAAESEPRHALAAGQYAYNPPHTRHNVFNTGKEPMRYIYVVAPAGTNGGKPH